MLIVFIMTVRLMREQHGGGWMDTCHMLQLKHPTSLDEEQTEMKASEEALGNANAKALHYFLPLCNLVSERRN